MDVHPLWARVARRHFHQPINPAAAQLRIAHHLCEFLVQKAVRLAPVDTGVRLREVEREEFRKVAGERVFPGAVEVVRGPVLGHGHVLVPVDDQSIAGSARGCQQVRERAIAQRAGLPQDYVPA